MINLKELSEEARGILVKAIPLYRQENFWEDAEYIKLYQDFLGATKSTKSPPGFNKFNGAILGMKRKLPFLSYKTDDAEFDIFRKSVETVVKNARRGENYEC